MADQFGQNIARSLSNSFAAPVATTVLKKAAPGIFSSIAGGAAAGSAVPIWGTIAGAGVGALGSILSAKKSSQGVTTAAKLQTDSANEGARISALSADKQRDFLLAESNKLRADTEASRIGNFGLSMAEMKNNYGQYVAGIKNNYAMFGDNAVNDRSSEISRGLTGVNMANTDAYNTRSLGVADRRNANAKDFVRQRRLGVLGEMLGQGPREIAAYEDPAALREAQYFTPDPLQRTALELPPELDIPEYVPGNRPPQA